MQRGASGDALVVEGVMREVLVTGGCGFLGSAIARALLGRGHRVRILALPGESIENVEGLDLRILRGDILDLRACQEALEGVQWVFHAAAVYKAEMADPSPMYAVNLDGTFNVLEAARRAGVERVIYTASIVALGRPSRGQLGDEQTPYEAWEIDFAYSRTKYLSRRIAEGFARWGLDVRVICPGIILGPGDLAPTPSGQLILESMAPTPPLTVDGGASYVDVRDAAEVHVLAAERGRPGQTYVATAHNLTNREFSEAIDRVLSRSRRRYELPAPLVRGLVKAMNALDRRRGRAPRMPLHMFEYSLRPAFFSNEKASRELGASFRPIEESIADAIADFRARGLV